MYVRPRLLYEKKFCSPCCWRLCGTSEHTPLRSPRAIGGDHAVSPPRTLRSQYWCKASEMELVPISEPPPDMLHEVPKCGFTACRPPPNARKPNVRQQARMAGLCVGARRAAVGLRGVTSRRGAAFSSTQWPVLFGYLFFTDKEKVTGSDAQHRKKARRYAVPKIPPKPPSRYFCSFC